MTNIIAPLLGIAEGYLKLRNKKEERKYLDEIIWLRKELYEETNKLEEDRNFARIDNIKHRLRIVIESVAAFE
jgi:hypothetical protein